MPTMRVDEKAFGSGQEESYGHNSVVGFDGLPVVIAVLSGGRESRDVEKIHLLPPDVEETVLGTRNYVSSSWTEGNKKLSANTTRSLIWRKVQSSVWVPNLILHSFCHIEQVIFWYNFIWLRRHEWKRYFKGLFTHTAIEVQKSFTNLERKRSSQSDWLDNAMPTNKGRINYNMDARRQLETTMFDYGLVHKFGYVPTAPTICQLGFITNRLNRRFSTERRAVLPEPRLQFFFYENKSHFKFNCNWEIELRTGK